MSPAERGWLAAMAFCAELAQEDLTAAVTEANNETGSGPILAHFSGWSAVKDAITSAYVLQLAYSDMLGQYTPLDSEVALFKMLRWGTPMLVDGYGFASIIDNGYADAGLNGIQNLANVSGGAETAGIALLAAASTHLGKLRDLFAP